MALFSSKNDSWIQDSIANSPVMTRWTETRAERRARKLRERAVGRAQALRDLFSEQAGDLGDLTSANARYLQILAARRARELGDAASARAQTLSDAASARSSDMLETAAARGRELSAIAAERGDLLRKQGNDAFENARARFLETDAYDRLKDIFPALTRLDNRKQRRNNALWWVLGATLGVAAAGAAIYFISRNRQPALETETLVELPNNSMSGDSFRGSVSNITKLDPSKSMSGDEGETATVDVKSPVKVEAAPLAGNVETLVYYDATDLDHLPSEENRIYFASETEAREAGYRPAEEVAGQWNQTERQ
jgi:hypothetical protein